MASSENLPSIEPWMFRPAAPDSWLSEYMSRDADTLTKALQKSLAGAVPPMDSVSPFINLVKTTDAAPTTPTTVSSLSGSDHDSAPKRQRGAAVTPTGKISKRKSRASKRSPTTFITADPANFRQMVQQVTGVRFGGSQMPMAPVLKPEPHRAVGLVGGGRLPATGSGCLPTLDTSAFLLDHQQQQQQMMVGPNSVGSVNGPVSGPGPLPFGEPIGALNDAAAVGASSFGSAGLDFDSFSSFPTLESWKVM